MNTALKYPRKSLKPEVLYLDCDRAEYFYSPSLPGVVWLTPEEADDMFGEDTAAIAIGRLED